MNLSGISSLGLDFLDYVLFRPWVDRDDPEWIVCSSDVMHGLAGSRRLVVQKKTHSVEILNVLKVELSGILPFEIRLHNLSLHRACCIRPFISDELKALVERRHILFNNRSIKLLSLIDRPPLSGREAKFLRDDYFNSRDCLNSSVPANHPMREEIIWLNSRKPHAFAKLDKYRPAAEEIAKSLDRDKAIHNLDTLIRLPHMQALYTHSEKSPRIFTYGMGLQGISKVVRKELFGPTAIHLDLEAAQLAIIAKVWSVSSLQELLRDNARKGAPDSAWDLIIRPIQRDFPQIGKKHIKSLIYPLAFGMSKKKLNQISLDQCELEFSRLSKSSEIISDIMVAREERKNKIKSDGKMIDVFGQTHRYIEPKFANGYSDNARPLMAYEAQAYEVILMREAVRYCMNHPRLSLDLLIHDGIIVRSTEKGKTDGFIKGITSAVGDMANKIDIITRLLVE
ncbi:hypothetical protein [Deinococcus sp. 12RED42]|uniref:hypothetical protein n=1 Tax=Deinococcus sp. 12RED42 TaxID=2745872 RepID=UPI001E55C6B8|nr:hypothetical protein [Deinococcus sp. 12RED42]MCD0167119.1 hypothetical protein [Deinococcus sp. 12RED42]